MFRIDLSFGRNQSGEDAMIFYENRLLGQPRIRMLKVQYYLNSSYRNLFDRSQTIRVR